MIHDWDGENNTGGYHGDALFTERMSNMAATRPGQKEQGSAVPGRGRGAQHSPWPDLTGHRR